MKIQIYEFARDYDTLNGFHSDIPKDCGYIEIPNNDLDKYDVNWCHDICSWKYNSAYTTKPEYLHSDIDNHISLVGVVFVYPCTEQDIHYLIVGNGYIRGTAKEIQNYATTHKDTYVWMKKRDEPKLSADLMQHIYNMMRKEKQKHENIKIR